jgi:hypothetical protein
MTTMQQSGRNSRIVLAVVAVTALLFAYNGLETDTERSVSSPIGTEIVVLRTPGGLLEVSSLQTVEHFDKRFVYELLGFQVGETVAHIRVPAVFRYRIELAPVWRVTRDGRQFTVVAPPFRPALPVAVDLAQMQQDVGGSWLLVPFNRSANLDVLRSEITNELAKKAISPAYVEMQREAARATVAEFVAKWLITQTEWSAVKPTDIRVLFSDEPLSAGVSTPLGY